MNTPSAERERGSLRPSPRPAWLRGRHSHPPKMRRVQPSFMIVSSGSRCRGTKSQTLRGNIRSSPESKSGAILGDHGTEVSAGDAEVSAARQNRRDEGFGIPRLRGDPYPHPQHRSRGCKVPASARHSTLVLSPRTDSKPPLTTHPPAASLKCQ